MSAIVGALRAVLSLESAAFTSGLKQAQGGLKRFQQQTQQIGKQMQKIGAVVSIAGAAMAAGIRRGINAADDMGDMAEKFGVPVETLSKLAYAATASGVSTETLGTSLRKLSDKMADAANGSKSASDLFGRLGISVTDAGGNIRATEDVLIDISAAIAAMPDGAEKAALSMDLFGKSGTDMLPFLNKGRDSIAAMTREAEELGLVISKDTADAAGDFNDSLGRLSAIMDGVFIQIAAELAPTFAKLGEKLIEMAKAFADMSPEMRSFLAQMALAVAVGGPLVISLGAAVWAVGALSGAFAALAAALAAHPILIVIAGIAAGAMLIWWNWEWLKEKMIAAWQAISDAAVKAWTYIRDTIGAAIDWISEKWDGFVGKIELAIEKAKEAGKAIADAVMNPGATTGGTNSDRTIVPGPDDWAPYDGGGSGSSGSNASGHAVGTALADGVLQGIMDGMARNAANLAAAAEIPAQIMRDVNGIQSPSKVFRGIGQFLTEGLGLGIKDGLPQVDAAVGDMQAVVGDGMTGLQTGADTLRDGFKTMWREVVTGAKSASDAVSALAARMADMLADSAFETLFGGGGGGIFAAIGKALGFADGGAFMGGRVIPFANGGVVEGATNFAMRGGKMGLMGEAGPEAIMPLTRGPGGRLGVEATGGARSMAVSIGFDHTTGGLTAWVRDEAGQVVAEAAPQIVSQSVRATGAAMRKTKGFGN